ncbi:MAG: acyltransferase [Alphaproteobacteria bacterium]|nr:acyltransferase [Alphaproteobacteria bacterium]
MSGKFIDCGACRHALMPLSFIGRFAVPFFFVTAGYYLKLPKRGDSALILAYARRLLVPFLFWAMVYVLYDMATNPAFPFDELRHVAYYRHVILYGGPGYHLWFLPSLFVCILCVDVCACVMPRFYVATTGLVLFFVGLALIPYAPLLLGNGFVFTHDTRNGPFFGMFFVAVGALFKNRLDGLSLGQGIALFAGGIATQVCEALFLWRVYGQDMLTHDYLFGALPVGIGAFVIALKFPVSMQSRLLAKWGGVSLGLYLSHVLFLKICASSFDKTTAAGSVMIVACSLVSTLALTLGLARWRMTRPLVA